MMSKFLKRIFQISIFFVIFLIILVVGITLFVDPNQFKGRIEQQIAKQTGYHLKIQGPIVWRWFPMLSLELNQIRLEAAEPFKEPIIASKSAKIEAELLPLLAGKLFANLQFDNLVLLLEKNAKGQGNWENLKQSTTAPTTSETTTAHPSNPPSAKTPHFVLNSINLKNSQIVFKNPVKNILYKFNNLNLSAENLFNNTLQGAASVPISLSFNVEDANKVLGNLALSSQCSLKTDQIHIRNLSGKFIAPEGVTTDLTGEALLRNLNTTPSLEGQLETKNLKLDTWLKLFNITSSPAIPSAIDVKSLFKYQSPRLQISSLDINAKAVGSLKASMDVNFAEDTSNTLNFKGNFSSKHLKIDRFDIKDLKGNLSGTNTAFTLAPLDFQIAGTSQHATLQADLRGATPRYSLTAESQGFEINQLLSIFDVKNKIQGKTRYQLKLTTGGKNLAEWRRALSGQANIEVNNGHFYGIDLITLLKSTQSNVYGLLNLLLNKQSFNIKEVVQKESQRWSANQSNTQASTPFNIAKATINIHNGSLKNPDLLIEHAEYKVTGEGSCDLNTLALQYHLAALLKNNPYPSSDKIASYLYSISLPIKITGTLAKPAIRPDVDAYTRNAFAYAQKHLLQEVIKKNLNQEVIEKNLNKALEHLFKKEK